MWLHPRQTDTPYVIYSVHSLVLASTPAEFFPLNWKKESLKFWFSDRIKPLKYFRLLSSWTYLHRDDTHNNSNNDEAVRGNTEYWIVTDTKMVFWKVKARMSCQLREKGVIDGRSEREREQSQKWTEKILSFIFFSLSPHKTSQSMQKWKRTERCNNFRSSKNAIKIEEEKKRWPKAQRESNGIISRIDASRTKMKEPLKNSVSLSYKK